jgi:hypothetical protein
MMKINCRIALFAIARSTPVKNPIKVNSWRMESGIAAIVPGSTKNKEWIVFFNF